MGSSQLLHETIDQLTAVGHIIEDTLDNVEPLMKNTKISGRTSGLLRFLIDIRTYIAYLTVHWPATSNSVIGDDYVTGVWGDERSNDQYARRTWSDIQSFMPGDVKPDTQRMIVQRVGIPNDYAWRTRGEVTQNDEEIYKIMTVGVQEFCKIFPALKQNFSSLKRTRWFMNMRGGSTCRQLGFIVDSVGRLCDQNIV